MLHRRTRHLRDRRVVERRIARNRDPDPRQLDPRRNRHRVADSARLHPDHHALHRRHFSRSGVRDHQRYGWCRRRDRPPHRRRDHDSHQLAGRVPLSGRHHRGHLLAQPTTRRSGPGRSRPTLRHHGGRPVRGRALSAHRRHPRGRQQRRRDGAAPRRRCGHAHLVLPLRPSTRTTPAENRSCRCNCSATGPRTSGS